jgi:4-oxalocrotonate tautomerase
MPIVTVQITREGATREQKVALIKGATDLLVDVLNKPPGLTFVVIQEVELEDWGIGGLPVPKHRRRASGESSRQAALPVSLSSRPEVGDQGDRVQ